MAWKKRLLKHRYAQMVLAWLLSLYIRFVFLTNRKQCFIDPAALPYMRGETNALFALWHGRMMIMPVVCPPNRLMRVLISSHRDGLLISRVISHFGHATVTGSSSKGGAAAVKEILRSLKNGDNIGITPDGPRGPIYAVERGAVIVARVSGKPLIPVTFSASRHKRFPSWDRFMLALPFGRIVFCVGAPILIAKDSEDDEQARRMIEQAMNRLMEQADGLAHG